MVMPRDIYIGHLYRQSFTGFVQEKGSQIINPTLIEYTYPAKKMSGEIGTLRN